MFHNEPCHPYELIDIENFRSLAEEELALDDREFLVNGEEF